jgi:Tol biopolymer transport system component
MGGGSGQIAFASDRSGTTQIWSMKVDGSGEPFQITDIFGGACQPDWSPDGSKLVFTSPCSKNQQSYAKSGIFIINADGTGQTPLMGVFAGDYDPAWSPDGTKIVFTSERNSGRPRIYLLDLVDNSVKRISNIYSRDYQPSWSPDGSKIAFVTNQKGPIQIWTMNPDGSEQQIYSRSADHFNSHPVWSRDGQTILFTQTEADGGLPNLVTASYDEGAYNEFAFNLGPTPAREARYSPDGLWLVFEGWPDGGNHEIFLLSASGGGRVQLTNWARDDFDPAWRPFAPTP